MSKSKIDNIVREPAVAGRFYPESESELTKKLNLFFTELENENLITIPDPDKITALIVPHAGYVFSGKVAASAFSYLKPVNYIERVILIGTSHYSLIGGASVFNGLAYKTPMGNINIDQSIVESLMQHPLFKFEPNAHENEHSLEVQLPFLQYIIKNDFSIVPILIGTENTDKLNELAFELKKHINDNTLIVVSTDLSHYPDYENANYVDKKTIDMLATGDKKNLLEHLRKMESKNVSNLATCMCGWSSVYTLMTMLENEPGVKYHPVKYANSGDINLYGDKNRVVGYQSMVVETDRRLKSFSLSMKEQKTLLDLCHHSIEYYFATGKKDSIIPKELSDNLKANCGAFVSVYVDEELRGCIGNMITEKPLYQLVQELAISSALFDSRFEPVQKEEEGKIKYEISVLTPLVKIKNIEEFVPGKHGIYIKKDFRSGTYLPQVAKKTGWNRMEMIENCSKDKAGIGKNGWKDADIFIYEAIIIK